MKVFTALCLVVLAVAASPAPASPVGGDFMQVCVYWIDELRAEACKDQKTDDNSSDSPLLDALLPRRQNTVLPRAIQEQQDQENLSVSQRCCLQACSYDEIVSYCYE